MYNSNLVLIALSSGLGDGGGERRMAGMMKGLLDVIEGSEVEDGGSGVVPFPSSRCSRLKLCSPVLSVVTVESTEGA